MPSLKDLQQQGLDVQSKPVSLNDVMGESTTLDESYLRTPDSSFFERSGNFLRNVGVTTLMGVQQTAAGIGGVAEISGQTIKRIDPSVLETAGQALNLPKIGAMLKVGKQARDAIKERFYADGYEKEQADKRIGSIVSDRSLGGLLSQFGKRIENYGEDNAEYLSQFRDNEIYQGEFLENPSWTRGISAVSGAIPSLATAFFATMATGQPAVGGAILGLVEGEDAYDAAMKEDGRFGEALSLFALSATGTGALESFSLGTIQKTGVMGKITGIALGAGTEGSTEAFQQVWNNFLTKYGADNTVKLFSGVVESMIAGAGSGGVISSFHSGQAVDNTIKEMNLSEQEKAQVLEVVEQQLVTNADEINDVLVDYAQGKVAAEETALQEQVIEEVAPEEQLSLKDKEKQAIVEGKLARMEAQEISAEAAQAQMKELKDVRKVFARGIAPTSNTLSEYQDLPQRYKNKAGRTYDQISEELNNLGFNVAGDATSVYEFFSNLDENIIAMEQQAQERMITDIESKLANVQMQFATDKAVTQAEIKVYQQDLIDTINTLPVEAKDKAKFLTNVKNANSYNQLYKQTQTVLNKAKTAIAVNQKARFETQIKREMKTTKDVRQGTKRVGRYDYESNKYFQELKDIFGMKRFAEGSRTELNPEIQAQIDAIGVPETEQDAMKLRALQLKLNGKKGSSVQMYRQVYEDLLYAKDAGRAAKDLNDFNKRMAKRWNVQEALDSIDKIKADKEGIATKIGNVYRKGFSNMYSMLNSIAGKKFAEQFDPELAENARETAKWDMTDEMADQGANIFGIEKKQFLHKITELGTETYTIVDFEGLSNEITKLELLDIYNSIKNEAIAERYNKAFGKEQITELISNLTEQEQMFADYLQFIAQSYYPVFNQRSILLNNKDLGRVDNYWPATSEHVSEVYDDIRVQGETPSAMKERATGRVIPVPKNAWFKIQKHIAQGEHVKHVSERYAQLKRMFDDRKVKHSVKQKFGEDVYNVLLNQIDRLSLNKQSEQLDAISSWIGVGLNNWVTAKVALSPSVFAKQLISAGNYMENMNSLEWTKYFAEGVKNPKKTFDFMWNAAPFLKARYGRGYSEAISRAMSEAEKIDGFKYNWSKAMTSLVRAGDIGAIIYGGYPMVKSLTEQGMSLDQAVKEFERATLKAQQSGLASGLSEWQNSRNPMARLFLAFKNTANQYFRKQADAIIEYQNGDITAKQLSKTLAIYGAVQPILYTMVGLAVRGALYGTEEDDYFGEILQGIALNPFNAIPIISDIANAVARKARGKKVWSIFPTPMLDDVEMAIKKLTKKEVTFYDVMVAIGTLAEPVTGAPINTYRRIGENIFKPTKRGRR